MPLTSDRSSSTPKRTVLFTIFDDRLRLAEPNTFQFGGNRFGVGSVDIDRACECHRRRKQQNCCTQCS